MRPSAINHISLFLHPEIRVDLPLELVVELTDSSMRKYETQKRVCSRDTGEVVDETSQPFCNGLPDYPTKKRLIPVNLKLSFYA